MQYTSAIVRVNIYVFNNKKNPEIILGDCGELD